jgi:hypothetical protein
MEKYFKVKEVAAMLGWGVDLTREVFKNEPGTLHRQKPRAQFGPIKRPYDYMTIAESDIERVKQRLKKPRKQ